MTEPTYQIAREAGRVRLSGDLDINARDEVRDILLRAVHEAAATRNAAPDGKALDGTALDGTATPGVVIDLADTAFIDSEAVGALLEGLTAGRAAGVPVAIAHAQGLVHRVLDIAGVLDLFGRAD